LDDVKLVALTLIRAGVQIKSIAPIPAYLTQKKDSPLIQVGASRLVAEQAPYSVDEIQNAKQFSR
jgi:hypothetical protein